MKINRLEAHDRLKHFKEDQSINIFKGAEDCLKINPLSLQLQDHSHYIYLFAHPRTDDDGVTKVMYWQPRLTKPKAQTNSYLFRAQSKTDIIETCWLIPPGQMWAQYVKGNVTESDVVLWSINEYKFNRENLQASEPDDLPNSRIKEIYKMIIPEKKTKLILPDFMLEI